GAHLPGESGVVEKTVLARIDHAALYSRRDGDEPFAIHSRCRFAEHAVDHRIDGGIAADSDRDHGNRGGAERGRALQNADAVGGVLRELLKPGAQGNGRPLHLRETEAAQQHGLAGGAGIDEAAAAGPASVAMQVQRIANHLKLCKAAYSIVTPNSVTAKNAMPKTPRRTWMLAAPGK